mmetsp:Transcript_63180/g.135671  ORF Transcript_63180/g.135671 Transcript_63180/m.135671 type:complete len:117 (+) Transcript_63180:443-793(+)
MLLPPLRTVGVEEQEAETSASVDCEGVACNAIAGNVGVVEEYADEVDDVAATESICQLLRGSSVTGAGGMSNLSLPGSPPPSIHHCRHNSKQSLSAGVKKVLGTDVWKKRVASPDN